MDMQIGVDSQGCRRANSRKAPHAIRISKAAVVVKLVDTLS